MSIEALLAEVPTETGEDVTELEEAGAWLVAYLEHNGGKAYSVEILKAAKAEGISERTLRRAKSTRRIKALKDPELAGKWVWMVES